MRIVRRNRAPDRLYSEAIPAMNRFVENRRLDETIQETVGKAMERRIGDSQEEAFKRLQPYQLSKKEIAQAWEHGLAAGDDPTTAWGLVQGLTAYAKSLPHIDKRVSLEQKAGQLLAS